MTDDSKEYYAAVAASVVSSIGWLGVLVGAGYTLSLAIGGGDVWNAATWTLVALGVGVWFARLEKRLYRADQ